MGHGITFGSIAKKRIYDKENMQYSLKKLRLKHTVYARFIECFLCIHTLLYYFHMKYH